MAHDEWIYFLGQVFGTVVVLPDRLVLHREHEGNAAGVPVSAGLQLARTSLKVGTEAYEALADTAREYARFIADGADVLADPQLARQAKRAAAEYQRVQLLWAARARVHESRRSRRQRFAELRSIVRHRGYRPRTEGGLGPKALLKDLAMLGLGR
jgi:hypothetical protein